MKASGSQDGRDTIRRADVVGTPTAIAATEKMSMRDLRRGIDGAVGEITTLLSERCPACVSWVGATLSQWSTASIAHLRSRMRIRRSGRSSMDNDGTYWTTSGTPSGLRRKVARAYVLDIVKRSTNRTFMREQQTGRTAMTNTPAVAQALPFESACIAIGTWSTAPMPPHGYSAANTIHHEPGCQRARHQAFNTIASNK